MRREMTTWPPRGSSQPPELRLAAVAVRKDPLVIGNLERDGDERPGAATRSVASIWHGRADRSVLRQDRVQQPMHAFAADVTVDAADLHAVPNEDDGRHHGDRTCELQCRRCGIIDVDEAQRRALSGPRRGIRRRNIAPKERTIPAAGRFERDQFRPGRCSGAGFGLLIRGCRHRGTGKGQKSQYETSGCGRYGRSHHHDRQGAASMPGAAATTAGR